MGTNEGLLAVELSDHVFSILSIAPIYVALAMFGIALWALFILACNESLQYSYELGILYILEVKKLVQEV